MRIGLRAKIVVTTVSLTIVILIVNGFVSWEMTRSVIERDQRLDKQWEKFRTYVRTGHQQTLSVEARAIARDDKLTEALARGQLTEARDRVGFLLDALIKEGVDLVIVTDKTSTPVWAVVEGRELSREAITKMRLVVDLRQSLDTKKDAYLLFEDAIYAFGGASARRKMMERGADGKMVETEGTESYGSVVLGTNLQRVMEEFTEQSEGDEARRIQLAFTSGNKVLASSFPKDKWGMLMSNIVAADKNQAERRPTLRFDGKNYDRYDAPLTGYNEIKVATIGNLRVFKSRESLENFVRRITNNMYVVSGIGIAAALFFGWIIAWLTTLNLRRFIIVSRAIAEGDGDLTRRIDIRSKDELGELARNLNTVFDKLRELAGRAQQISTSVATSSTQVCGSSQAMLEGAREQATRIHDSTAAATEMSASIQQVAENASQATKVAQEGGKAVNSAIDGMTRIRSTVEDAAEKIRALGESSKRIGKIVEVIRQISEQTSLLALNASIEAAHAGEHGRGFSVVADEVSQLAERTGQSAKDIEDLIATIRTQTEEAVAAMQTGRQEVVDGSKLVNATLSNLTSIVEVVQDTATAVKEQAIASDEIARNMDAVQRITQNVLQSSEETCSQGQRLVEMANLLQQSVSRFRIGDGNGPVDAQAHGATPLASPASASPNPALPQGTSGHHGHH